MTAETAKHGLAPSADHYESVQTIVDTDGLHLSCECHSDVSFTSEPLAGGVSLRVPRVRSLVPQRAYS